MWFEEIAVANKMCIRDRFFRLCMAEEPGKCRYIMGILEKNKKSKGTAFVYDENNDYYKIQLPVVGFLACQAGAVDAALLACAHTDGLAVLHLSLIHI